MNFLNTDARWTEHFVEVSDPHKEGHHVRFYFEPQRTWVGLTIQDVKVIEDNAPSIQMAIFMTEATLKDKNNGS
jgi:hypothetical protein